MVPLRDRFVCCCQMFCSLQWQQWCCTSRSRGRVPARCLGPCVWCCCWVPCTARLCRLSPAGGPRAVQLPAAPPALHAEGGGFPHCQAQHTHSFAFTNTLSPLGTCINPHIMHTNRPGDLFNYLKLLVMVCNSCYMLNRFVLDYYFCLFQAKERQGTEKNRRKGRQRRHRAAGALAVWRKPTIIQEWREDGTVNHLTSQSLISTVVWSKETHDSNKK